LLRKKFHYFYIIILKVFQNNDINIFSKKNLGYIQLKNIWITSYFDYTIKYVRLIIYFNIYWVLSPKNIEREKKWLRISWKKTLISIFLNTFNIIIWWINLIKKICFEFKFYTLLFKFISLDFFPNIFIFNISNIILLRIKDNSRIKNRQIYLGYLQLKNYTSHFCFNYIVLFRW